MFRTVLALALALASVGEGLAAFEAAGPAPRALVVRDIDGRAWTPLEPAAGGINLLFFISADCPISRRYAPEIDRIAAAYHARSVQTFFVYADSTLRPAELRANLREFHPGSPTPAIVDLGYRLTGAIGATVTPEAAIVSKTGRAYRGRIDDLYLNAGQTRRAPQHHDLRDALDATLAGRPIGQAETRAVGCFIERKEL